jgi:hypothetical protein
MDTNMDSTMPLITQYAKSTQNVTILVGLAIFLIILFVLSPINSFYYPAFCGKIIIMMLLGYTIYYNMFQTNKFATDFNIDIWSGDWNTVKTNIVYSHIFNIFLLILMITILNKFF